MSIGSTASGTDSVYIITVGRGDAVITATYDTPTADPVSVTCYVVTEGTTTINSVSGIDFGYDGEETGDYTAADITVPLFNLEDDVFGGSFDDADVLQQSPSGLHALLYTLEVENSTETYSTPIGNFDWDWVTGTTNIGGEDYDNVVINSEGSYVSAIVNDEEYTDEYYNYWGWQYEVNDVDPGHAPSATGLDTNDSVDWFFAAYSF